MRAEGCFLNKEEVDLVPIYRDPIHDFGFFRFDPSMVAVSGSPRPLLSI